MGFFRFTKWLPTTINDNKARKGSKGKTYVALDGDLAQWVEHLKALGFRRGRDFVIRTRRDGKRAIFRRGQDAIRNY